MPRDYKHSYHTPETRGESNKSWLWLVAGLILGGASAGLILPKIQPGNAMVSSSADNAPVETATPVENSSQSDSHSTPSIEPMQTASVAVDCTPVEQPVAPNEYTFYRLLPEMEIPVIAGRYNQPETIDTAAAVPAPTEPATPIAQPGSYLLQVASLRSEQDADGLVAKLALLGVSAHIQKITIDDETPWHRVRVGPIDLLEDVNDTREQLRAAGYTSLPLRIRE